MRHFLTTSIAFHRTAAFAIPAATSTLKAERGAEAAS
jgi:hypothetical protein